MNGPIMQLPAAPRWCDELADALTEAKVGCRARPSGPLIMGILNITPDSFFDGGRHQTKEAALAHARALLADGADIIDVGGESTRPSAAPVSEQAELDRVVPVIEALRAESDVVISIDTSKGAVFDAAVTAGANMLNDIRALTGQSGMLDRVCAKRVPVCLMHMQGEPGTMQRAPHYDHVVEEVFGYLLTRGAACLERGLSQSQVLLDPGFGFGKSVAHNLALLKALPRLVSSGFPVLLGASRKSSLGTITGSDERLHASVAAACHGARSGVAVLRVHDVSPTVEALKLMSAIEASSKAPRADWGKHV
jgi:dihydropteroate synthase